MAVDVVTGTIKGTGKGDCSGGQQPDPPIHRFPLLVWSPNHPVFGSNVFTSDCKASVEEIAAALGPSSNLEKVATTFSTTVEHVKQAIDYAHIAGIK